MCERVVEKVCRIKTCQWRKKSDKPTNGERNYDDDVDATSKYTKSTKQQTPKTHTKNNNNSMNTKIENTKDAME